MIVIFLCMKNTLINIRRRTKKKNIVFPYKYHRFSFVVLKLDLIQQQKKIPVYNLNIMDKNYSIDINAAI